MFRDLATLPWENPPHKGQISAMLGVECER